MRNPIAFVCVFTLLFSASLEVAAQARAAACFFTADFQSDGSLDGWDLGADIEIQNANNEGTGEFIPAWRIGNSATANADGYFPVPDAPVGNRFAMANDAAAPCNCAMSDVTLTLPVLDFTDRSGLAMECRVFHDAQFGVETATIESSVGGGPWTQLTTLEPRSNWQDVFIDLSAIDGQADVRIRFKWSDGGVWAGGFAVDDVCIRERVDFDVTLVSATIGDVTASAFDTGPRTLSYSAMPLEQASFLSVSIALLNRGRLAVPINGVNVNVIFNGASQVQVGQFPIGILEPGADTTVVIPLNWMPSAVGTIQLDCSIDGGTPDDDTSDNSVSVQQQITGPGWDNGYSAMASSATSESGVITSDEQFIVADRMELINSGSVAAGISVMLGTGTQAGSIIRAILMDANFALIDTSVRKTLTQEDIDDIWNGVPQYFPLSAEPELTIGDVFVGIQQIGAGENTIEVRTGSTAPMGRSALLSGLGFTVTYLNNSPMLRLHLSGVAVGVGDVEAEGIATMEAFPVPADADVRVQFEVIEPTRLTLDLFDATGRSISTWDLGVPGSGTHGRTIDTRELPSGMYVFRLVGSTRTDILRVQVLH